MSDLAEKMERHGRSWIVGDSYSEGAAPAAGPGPAGALRFGAIESSARWTVCQM